MTDNKSTADLKVQQDVPCPVPRVTIEFCTQCKWLLRAAYYAQELLSTFSVDLGEVALQPSTGGTFVVTIYHGGEAGTAEKKVLWDRRTDGGFPETKELKRRVRDVIEPGRDLGHVDRDHGATAAVAAAGKKEEGEGTKQGEGEKKEECEDCR